MASASSRGTRRRTVVASFVVLAVLVTFMVRLVDIQVVNAQEHVQDSLTLSLGYSEPLYGQRGTIVDSQGTVLASSALQYDCQLDPSHAGDVKRIGADGATEVVSWQDIAAEIGAVVGLDGKKVQAIADEALAEDPQSQFAYLKRGVSTKQYRELMTLATGFVSCAPIPSRSYPNGAVGGNLLGFMSTDSKALAGLELSENECLAAKNGSLTFQKGADGVVIPGTVTEVPAADGGTVTLTMDADLQWYMTQLIAEQVKKYKAKSGTISVVEVSTGKIRAMAEYPSVDPNDPSASDPQDRESRIFTKWFEPGSTFKALTAAMLIDAGKQTPLSTVTAAGSETLPNGARVTDSFKHGTYNYTLAGVLIDSSNVGIAKLSDRLTPSVRYDYLKKFGIGTGSAVDFAGELDGLVRPVDEWDNQTKYNTAFGQGLTTTVPELLGAFTALAHDGVRIPLSLVESCQAADGSVTTPEAPKPVRVVSAKTAKTVQNMLANVATQAIYAEDVVIPGYNIAAKTGTGEQSDGKGNYKANRYFTTMIGFAPAEKPQYVVAVTFDEPTRITSSEANSEGFQKAVTQVLKTFHVLPSTTDPKKLPKFG